MAVAVGYVNGSCESVGYEVGADRLGRRVMVEARLGL